jgi:predicted PurR-regulated permease PerM
MSQEQLHERCRRPDKHGDAGAGSARAEADGVRDSYDQQALQVAEYLWEEYRYRHDLVWRLVFRVTAVATALLIAPFLVDKSLVKVLGNWLLCLPILAILVILTGFYVLPPELELLKKIRNAYREVQNRALEHLKDWAQHETWPSQEERRERTRRQKFKNFVSGQQLKGFLIDHFEARVTVFMVLLFVAAVAFIILFYIEWLPELTTPA